MAYENDDYEDINNQKISVFGAKASAKESFIMSQPMETEQLEDADAEPVSLNQRGSPVERSPADQDGLDNKTTARSNLQVAGK